MVKPLYIRHKRPPKHSKMAMRLYHRRSSATRDKLGIPTANGSCLTNQPRLSLGACGHRDSLGGSYRPRSQSLFPGSDNFLDVPQRSRSMSFSGASRAPEIYLTASEEEHIFRCYTRVMYIILGSLAALGTGLLLYGMHAYVKWK